MKSTAQHALLVSTIKPFRKNYCTACTFELLKSIFKAAAQVKIKERQQDRIALEFRVQFSS